MLVDSQWSAAVTRCERSLATYILPFHRKRNTPRGSSTSYENLRDARNRTIVLGCREGPAGFAAEGSESVGRGAAVSSKLQRYSSKIGPEMWLSAASRRFSRKAPRSAEGFQYGIFFPFSSDQPASGVNRSPTVVRSRCQYGDSALRGEPPGTTILEGHKASHRLSIFSPDRRIVWRSGVLHVVSQRECICLSQWIAPLRPVQFPHLRPDSSTLKH
jgi:hypothetical protein